ncbi:NmrA family NAD(P)-binding protein [Micromonospora sp. WMMD956]|uniref:NAD(P)H-binding protein n=1 Tax=Micromonospora sp. WMMD956 TaxID=3016108 RepID=UPI002417AD88|nr:NmrA family NAD(P)-binding protein [Micromonospora sp. WMMD956]MDG4815798.1 NmrA family NAD(P)-binding protein [Micromonospora sp. WMMD956]
MIVGVTGASGGLGGRTVRMLAGAGHRVVALTRDPGAALAGAGRAAPERVEARRVDFDEPAGLPAALAGIDRLLIVSTAAWEPARRIAQHRAAIDAAVAAGVGHVVYTSLVACDGPPELLNSAHRATEEHLRGCGLPWTILRNAIYASGVAELLAPAVSTGRHVTNAGDGAVAYVARDDCAAVAAAVLAAGPGPARGLAGRTLDVTGPEALTADHLAGLLGARLGRPVEVVHVDDDAYRDGLVGAGTPAPVAAALVALGRAVRSGRYGRVSTTVPELTGGPARRVDASVAVAS